MEWRNKTLKGFDMNEKDFLTMIENAFKPLLMEMGFISENSLVSGKYYCASFSNKFIDVSISYEPGEEIFFIIISKHNSYYSDIDDRKKSPRLEDLNRKYMPFISSKERNENELYFTNIHPKSPQENKLLKYAKELRMTLPKYLNEINKNGDRRNGPT